MKKNQALLILALFFACGSYAQGIDTLLERYNAKVPQEKIYVHFDNSLYTPGQTVFYKAYLLSGNEVSELSKNLYLDLYDENGKIINRNIAPVIGSCAIGSFMVPGKYTGRKLQVLAYTKWMLNFDPSFLFHQVLAVAQTVQKNDAAVVPVTTLSFFPEGGDMVENIPSNIAFKALNSAAQPMPVKGTIYNRGKQPVATFISEHNGMGKVSFTPLPGEIYTAEWTDAQGSVRTTPLPMAKNSGLILSVNNGSTIHAFSIERAAVSDDRFKRITIVATQNQQVLFRADAGLADKTKLTASLPVKNFPSGIVQLTVFDNTRQPVAERIFFVNNNEYELETKLNTDTVNLEKRGRNVYSIEMADTIAASLSVSVTDGDGTNDRSQNIISQLLLSSEIKGLVHDPAYYFSDGDSVARHLDLVMLTNGWRRFAWDDVTKNKIPALKYGADTGYLSISGKIDKLSETKIKKAEMVNMILLAKDSTRQFLFAELQRDGSFKLDNLILFDTSKIFYQLNNTFIPARSQVSITNTFLPFDTTSTTRSVAEYLSDTTGMARIKAIADEQKRLDDLRKQTTLQEVVVQTKTKTKLQEMDEHYARNIFRGGRSHSFSLVDDPAANAQPNVFSYLRSKVPGITVVDPYGQNPRVMRRSTIDVSLFLDEMPVDGTTLATIPMTSIAYVKIIDPPFALAGAGGAVVVYSRTGDDAKIAYPGLDFTELPGYSPVKQFYSPNYAEKQINFSQADLRRTIFWQPDIQLDAENKKATISFYNNDISHTLQLVIEGLAADGRIVHVRKLIK